MYRDGVELEPIMNDENYDFNFQETRKLKEERIIHLVRQLMIIDGKRIDWHLISDYADVIYQKDNRLVSACEPV